jgi:hypothetical protein
MRTENISFRNRECEITYHQSGFAKVAYIVFDDGKHAMLDQIVYDQFCYYFQYNTLFPFSVAKAACDHMTKALSLGE